MTSKVRNHRNRMASSINALFIAPDGVGWTPCSKSKLSPQNVSSISIDIFPNKKIVWGDILEEKRESKERLKQFYSNFD